MDKSIIASEFSFKAVRSSGAAAAKRGLFLPDGLWPPGSAAAGARHYHTVRLRNGQGDCYPADRGRKAPGHAAFD